MAALDDFISDFFLSGITKKIQFLLSSWQNLNRLLSFSLILIQKDRKKELSFSTPVTFS